jgi:hypothetical protein
MGRRAAREPNRSRGLDLLAAQPYRLAVVAAANPSPLGRFRNPVRLRFAACKRGSERIEGSNPSPSASCSLDSERVTAHDRWR